MAETIQAIETIWAGCKFRSRLEARWAVFFNAIGYTIGEDCLYEYQDVVSFDGTRYLPDFYFPKEKIYAEVKGTTEALQKDSKKLGICIDYGGPLSDGIIILGNIPDYTRISWGNIPMFPFLYNYKGVIEENATFVYQKGYFGQRIVCKDSSIILKIFSYERSFDCEAEEIPKSTKVENRWTYYDNLRASEFQDLKDAYKKARHARFEHGEYPEVIHW